MTAAIVAQQPEAASKRWHLRIPHAQVSAKRIGENQHRCVSRAVDAISKIGAIDFNEGCQRGGSWRAGTTLAARQRTRDQVFGLPGVMDGVEQPVEIGL